MDPTEHKQKSDRATLDECPLNGRAQDRHGDDVTDCRPQSSEPKVSLDHGPTSDFRETPTWNSRVFVPGDQAR